MPSQLKYQNGFANYFSTEVLPGALPLGQNSPQKVPYGLVAELLSGTAFTTKRSENCKTWLYRIRPSVSHGDFTSLSQNTWTTGVDRTIPFPAAQLRWNPMPLPKNEIDFIDSVVSMVAHGDADAKVGCCINLYACSQSMKNRYLQNADGDLLFVPQLGRLQLKTELGILAIEPGEIAVIPRGITFQVNLLDDLARGYVCENYGQHFVLPELGPIGSNGLANPRDFQSPVAYYEELDGDFQLVLKMGGQLFQAPLEHSPIDVVAWHGNYVPYKYDLRKFNTINTVSFDHPDPSIFTVLTSPTEHPGVANIDFVIFPPRWMVAEHTFRPPYFHRNVMSEYMGLIYGVYDAKPSGGFEPGGGSLHNCMLPHGPEAQAYTAAVETELKPHYMDKTLAFMFESYALFRPSRFALSDALLQANYRDCWKGIPKTFRKSP